MLLWLSLFTFLSLQAQAEEVTTLDAVEVSTPKDRSTSLTSVSSDSAALLLNNPGVSLQTGGGLSSLPIIHGMADDRINITIDGANITASCPNHMNPAFSYIDPSKIASLEVMAGITPVSRGGDSIAGSIIVTSKPLEFSKQSLNLKTYFKSNNENQGAALSYAVASKKVYFGYSGMDEKANNYRDGNGKRLKSTLYAQNNQSVTSGYKLDDGVMALKLTRAVVPYEGFVNQYMDLVDNTSNLGNLSYKGLLGSAVIDSSLFFQHTNHKMDILSSERDGHMPMYTRSEESGYNIKADFSLNKNHNLIVGSNLNRYRLDDWWPPVSGTMMMGPNTFESINDGKRDRLGFFVETDSAWTEKFSTIVGLRTDIVSMDAGDVKGYNNTNNLPTDAAAFNSKSHSKKDHNYDATLLTKYKISPQTEVEVGGARKTRSPNLYERYAWAGNVSDPTSMGGMGASMDMRMINWFGDGNGYVGNLNLKPEVAHTLSTSFIAHDEAKKNWELKLTPYYSEVQNFIDTDLIGADADGTRYLRFANHDARIFGADFSGKTRLTQNLNLKVIAGYTRGYRKDGGAELYHLMPLNAKIFLQYVTGKWTSDLVTHLVNRKEQVNKLRNEPTTAGYALLDLGTSYQLSKLIKVDFAIQNIFDHAYNLPMGGVDLVNNSSGSRAALSGMGRSYNTALSIDFF